MWKVEDSISMMTKGPCVSLVELSAAEQRDVDITHTPGVGALASFTEADIGRLDGI